MTEDGSGSVGEDDGAGVVGFNGRPGCTGGEAGVDETLPVAAAWVMRRGWFERCVRILAGNAQRLEAAPNPALDYRVALGVRVECAERAAIARGLLRASVEVRAQVEQLEVVRLPERPVGRLVPRTDFRVLTTPDELAEATQWCTAVGRVALDLETSGLNPREDDICLVGFQGLDPWGRPLTPVYLVPIAHSGLGPNLLRMMIQDVEVVAHYAQFDLGFLWRHWEVSPVTVHCTFVGETVAACGAETAPGHRSLAACADRYLGVRLEKGLQTSDWSGVLSPEQLEYAARDVAVLGPLWAAQRERLREAGQWGVYDLECAALPAVVWAEGAGVGFDRVAWARLAAEAQAATADARARLDALAPARSDTLPGLDVGWDWDSRADVLSALWAVGVAVPDTADGHLAEVAGDHPLVQALRDWRGHSKRVSTYGESWLEFAVPDGVGGWRIYPNWVQQGSRAGRMSCRKPNVQQVPRGVQYRRCFVAAPGCVLVIADYSQIELRLAAAISGDEGLLDAFVAGVDIHTLSAQRITGREQVTPLERQMAKSANFGLLYGMGAVGLRSYVLAAQGVDLGEEGAEELRSAWLRAYPGIARWHAGVGGRGAPPGCVTRSGRRRLDVVRRTELLNTPVQGTGADGIKLAMAALWWRYRQGARNMRLVVMCHDELVIEVPEGEGESAGQWLAELMAEEMARLLPEVPVVVDVHVGRTWGEK